MSDLKVRTYEFARDYPEICEWWRARERDGWTYIPASRLPKAGFVVENDTHKFCVVFFYFCEGGWGWLEWLTTNPKAPLRPRKAAIELVLKTARDFWTSAGVHSVLSSLRNENLIELYQGIGFHRGQGGMTDMIWRVDA